MTIQLKKFFNFTGRTGRLETFIYMLIFGLVSSGIDFLLEKFMGASNQGVIIAVGIISTVLHLWVSFAIGAKRFHDLDISGWWQIPPFMGSALLGINFFIMLFTGFQNQTFITLNALLGVLIIIYAFLFIFKKGTVGKNKYGEDPLGVKKSQKKVVSKKAPSKPKAKPKTVPKKKKTVKKKK